MTTFLTASEVAERWRRTPQHIYNLRREGHLDAINVSTGGRPVYSFPLAAVEAFEQGRPQPSQVVENPADPQWQAAHDLYVASRLDEDPDDAYNRRIKAATAMWLISRQDREAAASVLKTIAAPLPSNVFPIRPVA